jgi:hypothetical protein
MPKDSPLADYLKTILKDVSQGNATEHTHRPALKSLVDSLVDGVIATNEPKRSTCGAPDFIVSRGQIPIGYIETKDVGISLDRAERTEQIKRYLSGLNNFVLTDYIEFRWYVSGEMRMKARLGKLSRNGKLQIEPGGDVGVNLLLIAFIKQEAVVVISSRELAVRMARTANLIYESLRGAVAIEDESGPLHEQIKGFRDVLIHDLTKDQFADMYAQTICYGLFAARCNFDGEERFTRKDAAHSLPKTNPFLRRLFGEVAGPELDGMPHAWAVDDLAELLNCADIAAILHDFGVRTKREDPVVHFYETFLAAYNPTMRELRGVYYTPESVVSYIVRSVDHVLKNEFALSGLADASKIKIKSPDGKNEIETHKVLILDPATGTGTFLYNVINHIRKSYRGNEGMWSGYVSKDLLPRIFGFELLMAPYAVAHMKLDLLLNQTGYDFSANERLRVYLTNTLEEVQQLTKASMFTRWLTEEADSASDVKQDFPVMVVMGNPPYSGHSANTGQWISHLLKGRDTQTGKPTGNYFEVDGESLGERNPKWLNDDYVKFIRFAQWRIEQTGYGVLAYISNHGYLDNPTFRGMRQSLMDTFDSIYILDLHGNSRSGERSPDGAPDENVFDIQQGVAIGIFIRGPGSNAEGANVQHAHLWGSRERKYKSLSEKDVSTTEWTTLSPQSPFYLFAPQDVDLRTEYERGWKVADVLPISVLGFQTHRDHFAIDFDAQNLRVRVAALRDPERSDDDLRRAYDLHDNRDWKLSAARKQLRGDKQWRKHLIRCLYRPFDWRPCYFSTVAMDYPRRELLDHVAGKKNLCLGLGRSGMAVNDPEWSLISVSRDPVDANIFRRGGINVFPLYLYPVASNSLFDQDEAAPDGQRPNLSGEFIAGVLETLKMGFVTSGNGDLRKTLGPEDVLGYIYAVFHSPTYRSRYAEFLKIDFPRLPLTSNRKLFCALSALGGELIGLHLMEKAAPLITTYPVAGKHLVEKVRYTGPQEGKNLFPPGEEEKGRVWINSEQYFEGVPLEVWTLRIGGFQVCQKWLKEREDRVLSYEEQGQYQRIVSGLAATIELAARIDETIKKNGGWPLA